MELQFWKVLMKLLLWTLVMLFRYVSILIFIVNLFKIYFQDFTYEEDYWKYVEANGAGLEHHAFAHLDCPLTPMKSSGHFVLAKFLNEQKTIISITAFQVNHIVHDYIHDFLAYSQTLVITLYFKLSKYVKCILF